MEKIFIKNFAGLDKAELELNRINIYIGQQASGKSITAKLLYFFKEIPREIFEWVQQGKIKPEITRLLQKKFEEYFPADSWSSKNFEINYFFSEVSFVRIARDKSKFKLEYSDKVSEVFTIARRILKSDQKKFEPEDEFSIYRPSPLIQSKYANYAFNELGDNAVITPLFIPAGRSFFANLQSSIFSFLSSNNAIDPFLVKFGSFYESIKGIVLQQHFRRENKNILQLADDLSFEILGGKYVREKGKDFLLHKDKRIINLSYASSGQQETLPLINILKAILRIAFTGKRVTVFIEEPEVHLFPEAQKKIVDFLALVFNNAPSRIQFVITTHSPYILTSLNTLMQASMVKNVVKEKDHQRLYKIIPEEYIIDNTLVNSYSFSENGSKSIIDRETGLVHSGYLDSVSENIATNFDDLLNLL